MKKATLLLLLLPVLLCGCAGEGIQEIPSGAQTEETAVQSASASASARMEEEWFTERDKETEYDENTAVEIRLTGSSAEADGDGVHISGTTVTITRGGTYLLTGRLEDGWITVDAPGGDKVQLVLAGVEITGSTTPAVYVRSADKVFLTLAAGTENYLANGGTFALEEESNIDGTLFSRTDLTLNGSGSLRIASPGGHGIVCKDDLAITGGTYVLETAAHGLDANDSIRITGDTGITAEAGKDGIHCENNDDASLGCVYIEGGTLEIRAQGDGISAGAFVQMENGSIRVLAGGGSENAQAAREDISCKGIKAAGNLLIYGGTFRIDAAEDALHADASLEIHGGNLELSAGDDAVHGEDTLTLTAGTIRISRCYEGLEALHLDIRGGDLEIIAEDDGLNAAGGADGSGPEGRDGFGEVPEGGGFGGEPPEGGGGFGGEVPEGGGGFGGEVPEGGGGFGGEVPEGGGGFGREVPEGGGEVPGRDGGRPGGMGGRSGDMGGMGPMSQGSGSIVISGGNIYIRASGDGLDANGTLEITGGNILVEGPARGDTATLDYDKSAVITGGTFVGTGAWGMAQTFSASGQGVITLAVGNQGGGTTVTLKDTGGNVLLAHTPELDFAAVILSSPELVAGETYILTVGAQSEEVRAE